MDKEIKIHKEYVSQKLSTKLTKIELENLYLHHIDRVRDFQHERIVHLYVTLFFAVLSLLSLVLFVLTINSPFSVITGLLAFIICALEIVYIIHYYKLENGVQSLYKITKQFQVK